MPLSECACEWDGTPSKPKMRKPCVAHLEWMRQQVRNEREACAAIADDADTMEQSDVGTGMGIACERIAMAIRARPGATPVD